MWQNQRRSICSIQKDVAAIALAVPIVAFANADGGVIAIGVSDKTRKIEGIDQHTEKLNELLRVPFGANVPSFRTDEFILKITVSKVAENIQKQTGNVTENGGKVAENHNKVAEKVADNHSKVTEKLREKAAALGETLTVNRIKILELMIEDPYISRADLANNVGISETSIYRNIEAMRGKYLRRVGPDKGGFWEIIE